MKKILILGIISLVFAIDILFYGSFTKYNRAPRKLVEQYLEEHYGKEFQLISSEYLKVRDDWPYLWKFRYRDEEGMEFSIHCAHPYKSIEGGYCLFFSNNNARIDDYYWAKVLLEEYGEELKLKDRVEETEAHGSENYTYHFNFNTEEEMEETAYILAKLSTYTLENVKVPSRKVFSAWVYYKNQVIWGSTYWFSDVCESYFGSSEEELYDFFYNKMLKKNRKKTVRSKISHDIYF